MEGTLDGPVLDADGPLLEFGGGVEGEGGRTDFELRKLGSAAPHHQLGRTIPLRPPIKVSIIIIIIIIIIIKK
jgi:hypothetical protein